MIFNIQFQGEIRNIADMKEFNWLPFSINFMQAMPTRQKNMVHLCRSLHLPQTWANGGIVCRVVWTCPRKLPTLGQVPLKMRFSWSLPHTASPPLSWKWKSFGLPLILAVLQISYFCKFLCPYEVSPNPKNKITPYMAGKFNRSSNHKSKATRQYYNQPI